MNADDSEKLVSVLDDLGEDQAVFAWCSADPDGAPLLLLDSTRIDSKRLLTLLRKAVDKTIVRGTVERAGDVIVFIPDDEPPPLMREQLRGVFAEVDARLARARVRWGDEEEEVEEQPESAAPATIETKTTEAEVKPAEVDWNSDDWDFDDDEAPAKPAAAATPAKPAAAATPVTPAKPAAPASPSKPAEPAVKAAPAASAPVVATPVVAAPTVAAPAVAAPDPTVTHAPVPAPPRPTRPVAAASQEEQLRAALMANPSLAPLATEVERLREPASRTRAPVANAIAERDRAQTEAREMLDGLTGKNGQTWIPRLRTALDAAAAASVAVHAAVAAAAPAVDALTDAQYNLSDAVTAAGDNTVNGLAGALHAAGKTLPWFPEAPLPEVSTGGATPSADGLAAGTNAMKKAVKDFKFVARTRLAADMLPSTLPDLAPWLAGAPNDPNVAAARGHLVNTMDALVDANRQVVYYLGFRRDLSEAQLTVIDANVLALAGLIGRYHEAVIALTGGAPA